MEKKELMTGLHKALSALGFIRKSSTWYLEDAQIWKVINVQRSAYGPQCYINLGIYFKGLGSERYPKQHECHTNLRMASDFVGCAVDYYALFDLEHVEMNAEEFQAALNNCVNDVLVPQLELMRSKEGLLAIAADTPAILNIIPLQTKAFLGIEQ